MRLSVSYFVSFRFRGITYALNEFHFRTLNVYIGRACVFYPPLTNHFEMRNGFRAVKNCVCWQCVCVRVWERPKFLHDAPTECFSLLFFTLSLLLLHALLSVSIYLFCAVHVRMYYWFCWPLLFISILFYFVRFDRLTVQPSICTLIKNHLHVWPNCLLSPSPTIKSIGGKF